MPWMNYTWAFFKNGTKPALEAAKQICASAATGFGTGLLEGFIQASGSGSYISDDLEQVSSLRGLAACMQKKAPKNIAVELCDGIQSSDLASLGKFPDFIRFNGSPELVSSGYIEPVGLVCTAAFKKNLLRF